MSASESAQLLNADSSTPAEWTYRDADAPLSSSAFLPASQRMLRIAIGAVVAVAVIAGASVGLYLGLRKSPANEKSDGDNEEECYAYPTCEYSRPVYDPETGHTNYTGFARSGSAACCDICNTSAPLSLMGESSPATDGEYGWDIAGTHGLRRGTYGTEAAALNAVVNHTATISVAALREVLLGEGERANAIALLSAASNIDAIFRYRRRYGSHVPPSAYHSGAEVEEWRRASSSWPSSQRQQLQSMPYRYDYLLVAFSWLPQFCEALRLGHDPTLSHPRGAVCDPSVLATTPRLTLHGLWPNLFEGYEVCCADINPRVLDDERLRHHFDGGGSANTSSSYSSSSSPYSYAELMGKWLDPVVGAPLAGGTISSSGERQGEAYSRCASCYLLNHEWQKHGNCFSSTNASADHRRDETDYLEAGLQLFEAHPTATAAINAMAGLRNATVAEVRALFPAKTEVVCDPNDRDMPSNPRAVSDNDGDDAVGNLIEVRTCYLPVEDEAEIILPHTGENDVGVGVNSFASVSLSLSEVRRVLDATPQLTAGGGPLAAPIRLPNGVEVVPFDCPAAVGGGRLGGFTEPCPDTIHVPVFSPKGL